MTERKFMSQDILLDNNNSIKTNLGTHSLYHNFLSSLRKIEIKKQK